MTAQRVTVSLPPELVAHVRDAVAAGEAESISQFVAGALHTRLARVRALGELESVLGGRPPQHALDAVRRDLGLTTTA